MSPKQFVKNVRSNAFEECYSGIRDSADKKIGGREDMKEEEDLCDLCRHEHVHHQ
jgi:hypothetical protein